jgi:hypothetical protein
MSISFIDILGEIQICSRLYPKVRCEIKILLSRSDNFRVKIISCGSGFHPQFWFGSLSSRRPSVQRKNYRYLIPTLMRAREARTTGIHKVSKATATAMADCHIQPTDSHRQWQAEEAA